MAALTPVFRIESAKLHQEHEIIMDELDELDAALDHLDSASVMHIDLHARDRVVAFGLHLMKKLPEHCKREEEKLFTTVASISPELAAFAQEMQRQHSALRDMMDDVRTALEALESAENLATAIARARDIGKNFTRTVRAHIASEENTLSGFL